LKIEKICLAYNLYKEESLRFVERFEEILEELKIQTIRLPVGSLSPFRVSPEDLSTLSLTLSFGGDGTLLSVARFFSKHSIPVMGINLGNLGFLTEAIKLGSPKKFIQNILKNNFKLEKRSMLEAEIFKEYEESESLTALNDIVISRSSRSSVLGIHLKIDGNKIAEYTADGLIVSTPTGSTAYALASGGAVLAPDIRAIGIVPICPHSLTSRPLVISDKSKIEISISCRNRRQSLINVQADGQEIILVETSDLIKIKASRFKTSLIKSKNSENNFYKILSKKLLWAQSFKD